MKFQIFAVSLSLIALALLFPTKSAAVPSYARQTGLPCSGCHYNTQRAAVLSCWGMLTRKKREISPQNRIRNTQASTCWLHSLCPRGSKRLSPAQRRRNPELKMGTLSFPRISPCFFLAHGQLMWAAFSSSLMTRKGTTSAWTTRTYDMRGRDNWRGRTGFMA